MVEFSVYNAQVNIFAIVTTVAEFVGGGVWPYYRVETFRLFSNPGLMKYITLTAQVLFIALKKYSPAGRNHSGTAVASQEAGGAHAGMEASKVAELVGRCLAMIYSVSDE